MATWLQQIVWSDPHSISQLTSVHGARSVIPSDKGLYAFVEGSRRPCPQKTLYLGVAVGRRGIQQRLGSYLRRTVNEHKAGRMKHRGKRLISFARIKGVRGTGSSTTNTARNDRFIHVCWAIAPLDFTPGSGTGNEREWAFMLERALIDYYRPLYNTADWEGDWDFGVEDEAWDPEDVEYA